MGYIHYTRIWATRTRRRRRRLGLEIQNGDEKISKKSKVLNGKWIHLKAPVQQQRHTAIERH